MFCTLHKLDRATEMIRRLTERVIHLQVVVWLETPKLKV